MGTIEWGAEPEFYGPRYAHREGRIVREVLRRVPQPGRHLECAAGLGSLSLTLARRGFEVVAADSSLRSLAHLVRSQQALQKSGMVSAVVADINRLPFLDQTFSSASSAETLEHLEEDRRAAAELGRTLEPGAWLVGTVPADPGQFSDWDEWAGHRRRYTRETLGNVLRAVGPELRIVAWGWPILRLYDRLFLLKVNRRRLRTDGPAADDAGLRRVSGLGRRRWLVRAVRAVFELDRIFDGAPWGVGLLFAVRRPGSPDASRERSTGRRVSQPAN